MSIRRSNCTNGVVQSRGMGYGSAERRKVNVLAMKCLRVWLECHEWIELGMNRYVGELE